MKHSNWIMLFFIFFLCMAVPVFIKAAKVSTAASANTDYAKKLTIACHSAIQTIKLSSFEDGDVAWGTEDARNTSVNTLFDVLAANLGSEANDNRIRINVPIVLMVDENGYYIDSHTQIGSTLNNSDQISSIYTWTATDSGYVMSMRLDNTITMTCPDGTVYSGNYNTVKTKMSANGQGAGTALIDSYYNGAGQVTKEEFIIQDIKSKLEYFINQENKAETYGAGYRFEMPVIKGEDWSRMLQNPTIIAFLQGKNIDTGKTILNTYAFSGAELSPGRTYFITELDYAGSDGSVAAVKYYHDTNDCYNNGSLIVRDGSVYYEPNDDFADNAGAEVKITRFFGSMKDCALAGAEPCPKCVR